LAQAARLNDQLGDLRVSLPDLYQARYSQAADHPATEAERKRVDACRGFKL
jgi:hypothetical protein